MTLDKAIKLAMDGEAILFLGSGASIGAKNKNNSTPSIGTGLAEKIWAGCDDLQQSVDLFLDSKNKQGMDAECELIDLLKNEFTITQITEQQKLIPNIPWKRVYTTNYDNVVEKSYFNKGKNLRSLTLGDKARNYISNGDLLYLHINGSINSLSKDTLQNQFKLSDVSYNTNDFTDSDWGNLFCSDLKTYSVIIFIGFSMRYDLDIRRLINEVNKDKCIFIVSNNENENNIKYLNKYGAVECVGFKGFFDKFIELQKEYEPCIVKTVDNTALSNFENKNNASPVLHEPSDGNVLSYYMTGKRTNELYYPTRNGYKAIVKRHVVDKVIDDVNKGIKAIFIHSDIGNGKSEIVEQICLELSNEYRKCVLIDTNEKIDKEIELICNSNYKNVIVINNFFNYYSIFQKFNLFNSKNNIIFIFTSRTSIFRNRYESFNIDDMTVYDLNRLNENEIDDLVSIFNEYGYFLDNSSGKNIEEFIRKDCRSRLQSVILSMFDNSDIRTSLNELTDGLFNRNNKNYDLLILLVLIKVMALEIDFEDALNLLNVKMTYNFEKSSSVNEIIDWRGSRTSIKSVALCVWLLKNCNIIFDVKEVLIKICEAADLGYEVNSKYRNFLGNIISYRHLKFIFETVEISRQDKLNLINDFYQKIKNLEYYNGKYYFWLQYGISALELNDYDGADMHFKAAYNKLPDNMQPFEIDNQYARLIMEKMLLEKYKYNSSTYSEFDSVCKLLTPTNAQADDKFYCFKMAFSYYRRIFDKFYLKMNDFERKGLKKIARATYKLCKAYSNINKNNNFSRRIQEFENEFMKLAFYESYALVDFHVEYISRYFAKGTYLEKGVVKEAQVHISQISSKQIDSIEEYLKPGQTVKAKIIKYNQKQKCWELSLKQ